MARFAYLKLMEAVLGQEHILFPDLPLSGLASFCEVRYLSLLSGFCLEIWTCPLFLVHLS